MLSELRAMEALISVRCAGGLTNSIAEIQVSKISRVDNDKLKTVIEADPLETTQEVLEEVTHRSSFKENLKVEKTR